MRGALVRLVGLVGLMGLMGLMGPVGLKAQGQLSGIVRHNCWDIDMGHVSDAARTPFRLPHIVAEADTGLLLVGMAKEYIATATEAGVRRDSTVPALRCTSTGSWGGRCRGGAGRRRSSALR